MTFEVQIEHDESPCVVDAEDWEFGPHGALMFYDADRNLVEVFRGWTHMVVGKDREEWPESAVSHPDYLAEQDEKTRAIRRITDDLRGVLGVEPTATKTWHDPAIQALKDAWAELCDRGHDAAADTVFQMIQSRTGLEGLEYEVKREIPQTAPGKAYQPEQPKTIDATGGNADADLFQPGWSKAVFVGGPIHGHEGLLPAGVSMMLVVRGDHSYSYSLEPQGNAMTYVGRRP